MKESTAIIKKFLSKLYKDIFRNTIIFMFIGWLIVIIINTWRFRLELYFIAFLIAFSISYVICFMKKEKRFEFENEEV